MKTKIIILGVIATVAIGSIFNSCKKDEQTGSNTPAKQTVTTQSSTKSAGDNALAESAFGGIFKQADKAARNTSSKDINSGCPTVTINPITSYPMTITIDFGTSCTCDDGKIRSGKIIAVLSAPYIDSASVLTVTLDSYHEIINGTDYSVQGTETITNLGHNQAGHPVFSVVITNGVVSSVNGTIHWTSSRQNEWIQGYNTWFNVFDDVYLVTGTASGTDSNGETFQVNITSPLRVDLTCSWIDSGTLEIITQAYPPIVVDYGNGTCDNIATVTCAGYTFTIYM
jgi:hypothetical protein